VVTLGKPRKQISKPAAQPIHQSLDSHFDVGDSRRTTLFEFENDPIHSTHSPVVAIFQWLVKTISD
jgi:hypothetical protein